MFFTDLYLFVVKHSSKHITSSINVLLWLMTPTYQLRLSSIRFRSYNFGKRLKSLFIKSICYVGDPIVFACFNIFSVTRLWWSLVKIQLRKYSLFSFTFSLQWGNPQSAFSGRVSGMSGSRSAQFQFSETTSVPNFESVTLWEPPKHLCHWHL